MPDAAHYPIPERWLIRLEDWSLRVTLANHWLERVCYYCRVGLFRLGGNVVKEKPVKPRKGYVLLALNVLPYLDIRPAAQGRFLSRATIDMAQEFVGRGYEVHIINNDNKTFRPKHKYAYFVGIENNFDYIAGLLNSGCHKIFYPQCSYWGFNNAAEAKRVKEVADKRGVEIPVLRTVPPNDAHTKCDTMLYLSEHQLSAFPTTPKDVQHMPLYD